MSNIECVLCVLRVMRVMLVLYLASIDFCEVRRVSLSNTHTTYFYAVEYWIGGANVQFAEFQTPYTCKFEVSKARARYLVVVWASQLRVVIPT